MLAVTQLQEGGRGQHADQHVCQQLSCLDRSAGEGDCCSSCSQCSCQKLTLSCPANHDLWHRCWQLTCSGCSADFVTPVGRVCMVGEACCQQGSTRCAAADSWCAGCEKPTSSPSPVRKEALAEGQSPLAAIGQTIHISMHVRPHPEQC